MKEEAQLAPAPEEPETSALINMCIGNVTESSPEWRELGLDEVICEGDEYFWDWRWYWPNKSIGLTPKGVGLRFRTRRPLLKHCPLQEPDPEWRELGEDEVIQEGDEFNQKGSYDWLKCGEYFLATYPNAHATYHPLLRFRTRRPLPKQEEKAPNHFHAWMHLQESINKEVAVELQKLRDEIQKLKEAP